jgi:hypothetical protein
MGNEPGEDARGQAVVTLLAFGALLIGSVASVSTALRGGSGQVVFLLPLAAAAYVVTHFYAFDPYYLPSLRRFTESGVSATWVYGVCSSAILCAALVRFRPRVGLAITPLLLLVCGVTVIAQGVGH